MNLGKQGDEEQLGEGKEYDQNMLYIYKKNKI